MEDGLLKKGKNNPSVKSIPTHRARALGFGHIRRALPSKIKDLAKKADNRKRRELVVRIKERI
jgi:hypothetical protein